MIESAIARWLDFVRGDSPDALSDLLADDVVFYSPVVYRPQVGKQLTTVYLEAAKRVLAGDAPESVVSLPAARTGSFRYTKQVLAADTAVLEFETTLDGRHVNGVDIIRCDADGRIVEFRVMIRPLQAINLVHQRMAAALDDAAPPD